MSDLPIWNFKSVQMFGKLYPILYRDLSVKKKKHTNKINIKHENISVELQNTFLFLLKFWFFYWLENTHNIKYHVIIVFIYENN